MTEGDLVHYHEDFFYDRKAGVAIRNHHRVGRFVREITKGKYKGLIEIEHGGKIQEAYTVRIEPDQIIGDA